MKPLGIVLLFINLLAAGAVAYLATQAWARRQEQNTAILKHELAIDGFPTESAGAKTLPAGDEDAVKVGGHDVRAKVLKEHFAGAARAGDFATLPAVPLSVVGEVEEMKKQIDIRLAGLPNDLAKLAYLVGSPAANNPNRLEPGLLSLLADDVDERMIYREWLAEAQKPQNQQPAPVPAAELFGYARAALDAKFDLALLKPDTNACDAYEKAKREAREARDRAFIAYQKADKGPGKLDLLNAYSEAQKAYWKALAAKSASLTDVDRRKRAAGLMLVLDPTPSGQKRTALLVGLRDYVAAVEDRTGRLVAMPSRYERQGESELESFSVVYKEKLATSRELDRMLQRQVDITRTFATQEKLAAAQVQVRTKHRDDAQGRVSDLDAKVKAAAAAQQTLEKEILNLQFLVGARFDELFQLEEQVFQAERQKAGK
jgi:hypothetical protein